MRSIAIYGKGGIGKSTILSNLTVALAERGHKVLQIGCDPKHDSTRLLLGGFTQSTVLDRLNTFGSISLDEVILTGFNGIKCIESGGPEPGVGCAGRGIIQVVGLLKDCGLDTEKFDYVFFDVLGDVVCGGFAVPMRNGYANEIYIVTSGEFAALYAANNIARGLRNYSTPHGKLGGVIGNERGTKKERALITEFAKMIGTEMIAYIPRSELISEAELNSKTVMEYAPKSELANIFRSLADIVEHRKSPVTPTPIPDEKLAHFVTEFSYGTKQALTSRVRSAQHHPSGLSARGTASQLPIQKGMADRSNGQISEISFTKRRETVYGCSLAGAYNAICQIKDAVAIMHSPQGCAYISLCTSMGTSSNMNAEATALPNLLCTNMQERDVVFGGEKLLRDTILRTHSKLSPTAIFVITSCPAGIIGEDTNRTIGQLKNEGIEVCHVSSDGVMGGDFNAGMLGAYKFVAEHFIDESTSTIDDAINIVGEPNLSIVVDQNFAELKKILRNLELKVNCRFIRNVSLEAIRNFKRAKVNIPATNNPIVQTLIDFFETRFHMETLEAPLPLAFEQTEIFIRALGSTFAKESEADKLIAEARIIYDKSLSSLREYFSGKRVLIFSTQNIDWLISTLMDLDVEILKIGLFNQFYLRGPISSKYEGKIEIEPNYPFEKHEQDILENRPDLVLMNYMPKHMVKGAQYDIFPIHPPTWGFYGGTEYVSRLLSTLKIPFIEGWRQDEHIFRSSA